MRFTRVLAGYTPRPGGGDALALAVMLARAASSTFTVAVVRPPGWSAPSSRGIDAEWTRHLQDEARAALDEAARLVVASGGERPGQVLGVDRGSGRGLAALARRTRAGVVVIGSPSYGPEDRISLGGTAYQLLHSSPVPVALAPREYGRRPPADLERLTVAYRRGPGSETAVRLAAAQAARLGVRLRLLTLVIRDPAGRGARRPPIEEEVLARARERYGSDLASAAGAQRRRGIPEIALAEGDDAAAALASVDWLPGELLLCASSRWGPRRRVFLGDTSLKIVQSSACPVMILPRASEIEPIGKGRNVKA